MLNFTFSKLLPRMLFLPLQDCWYWIYHSRENNIIKRFKNNRVEGDCRINIFKWIAVVCMHHFLQQFFLAEENIKPSPMWKFPNTMKVRIQYKHQTCDSMLFIKRFSQRKCIIDHRFNAHVSFLTTKPARLSHISLHEFSPSLKTEPPKFPRRLCKKWTLTRITVTFAMF